MNNFRSSLADNIFLLVLKCSSLFSALIYFSLSKYNFRSSLLHPASEHPSVFILIKGKRMWTWCTGIALYLHLHLFSAVLCNSDCNQPYPGPLHSATNILQEEIHIEYRVDWVSFSAFILILCTSLASVSHPLMRMMKMLQNTFASNAWLRQQTILTSELIRAWRRSIIEWCIT